MVTATNEAWEWTFLMRYSSWIEKTQKDPEGTILYKTFFRRMGIVGSSAMWETTETR